MADDDLDVLYAAKPEEFTALRTKLAAEAKKRGDADTAKQITAARKPTTAAYVVNLLVLDDASARGRLTELGERLRDAHAGMDGEPDPGADRRAAPPRRRSGPSRVRRS